MAPAHVPVLVREVIEGLAVQPGGRYIDCTLGAGGHAAAILRQSSPGGQLLGLDADPEAVSHARERLAEYHASALLVNENFANLRAVAERYGYHPVHGILFDLGLASFQLESDARGFSFQRESALDMRYSPDQDTTAEDIINGLPEKELADLLRAYGEEPRARRIASRIVRQRPVHTTRQLASIVEEAVGGRHGRTHPATRTFQALRIAVNGELEHLQAGLEQALSLLGIGGRLAVISYHSLEDRLVKRFMQRESRDCICPPATPACICGHSATLRLVNRRVITPGPAEVEENPRSRSGRLRVAERIGQRSGLRMAPGNPRRGAAWQAARFCEN
jgi:16S rRNA (cytosine1402-N4)-methyltransferase